MEKGKRQKVKGRRLKVKGKRQKAKGTWLGVGAILCSLFVIAGSAQAPLPQPEPRSNTEIVAKQPPTPPDGFVPASSLPSQEQLPAAPLVIGAYSVAWVLVFGYLWSIWRRLERLETELAEVRRRVAAGPSR
jgi:CcmD family protein